MTFASLVEIINLLFESGYMLEEGKGGRILELKDSRRIQEGPRVQVGGRIQERGRIWESGRTPQWQERGRITGQKESTRMQEVGESWSCRSAYRSLS